VASRHFNLVLEQATPVALRGVGPSTGWPTALAISPAGDRLVYVAPTAAGTQLRLRALSGDSSVAIEGTVGATAPIFSPDGEWVAYFAGEFLHKVSVSGGPPVALVKVDRPTGAIWAEGDRILLLESEGFNLRWISASGAVVDSAMALETQFGAPDLLPGGEWAVGELSSGQLALLSLKDGVELAITRRGILPLDSVRPADLLFGTSPRYLASGHLLYATDDGVLNVLPFDGKRREVLAAPAPLLSGVRMEAGFGYAQFVVARDGTLIYVPGRNQFFVNIVLVSPDGSIDSLPFPRGPYTQPRLSRDGTQLAVQSRTAVGGWEVQLFDLESGQRRRLEVEGNYRPFPASWLPDGRSLLVGTWDPVRFINYGARVQSLETGRYTTVPLVGGSYLSVSPSGEGFVFSDWRTGALFYKRFEGDTTRVPLPGSGFAASFSRDGRWLAWGDLDGGISASPFPATGSVYRLAERGQMPLWTPDGSGLLYRDGGRYYRLPVSAANGLRAGRPSLFVEGPFLSTFAWNHDISPDGRLLALLRSPEVSAPTLGVITGVDQAIARVTGRR
jgi:serine/threonine-protein kinase